MGKPESMQSPGAFLRRSLILIQKIESILGIRSTRQWGQGVLTHSFSKTRRWGLQPFWWTPQGSRTHNILKSCNHLGKWSRLTHPEWMILSLSEINLFIPSHIHHVATFWVIKSITCWDGLDHTSLSKNRDTDCIGSLGKAESPTKRHCLCLG